MIELHRWLLRSLAHVDRSFYIQETPAELKSQGAPKEIRFYF